MLISTLILLLLSNSVTLRRDKSILYSRESILILCSSFLITYNNLYFEFLNKDIGIFGGLFYSNSLTFVFHIFILLVSSVILLLNSFYPRKVWLKQYSSIYRLLFTKLCYKNTEIINKMGEQYRIIEYSLIILFIVTGALFLISSSDLVSIFLSIELQSYGLYLLSAIYRDSEQATSGGLMYFLLGGLSSCFILLSTSLLYANSGTTNLDNLYIITSISNVNNEDLTSLFYWYKSSYIHISLLFMSVGFLFKVSAAPFHFWSPDVYDAIPTIVTTFVAIIAKVSIFIFLLELVHYTGKSMFDLDFSWTMSLLFSSLLSLVVGTIGGLTQSRIKRLYAFSTISHVGFILLSLSIHTIESTQAFMFYLMQYSISNLNAFIIIITIGYTLYFYINKDPREILNLMETFVQRETGSIIWQEYAYRIDEIEPRPAAVDKTADVAYIQAIIYHAEELGEYENFSAYTEKQEEKLIWYILNIINMRDEKNSPIQRIYQLRGYYSINPLLSLSLAITLFSFAGIPPLIGFFGKQMILSAALANGYVFMSLIAIITSVISAVYYLIVIKEMFFYRTDYTVNSGLCGLEVDGLITEEDYNIKQINIKRENIFVSSSLSLTISIITLVILLFILIPQESLSLANLLALILFNI